MTIFSTGMKNKWSYLNYIDLFAGPGLCYNFKRAREILGSPLLSLNTRDPFTSIHLVEMKERVLNALRKRVLRHSRKDSVYIYEGDCNEEVANLRNNLSIGYDSLDLAFLDPEGFELSFETIRALTKDRKMDLIVNFPTSGIRRNIQKTASRDSSRLDLLVPGWREVYRNPLPTSEAAALAILDHFKKLLEGIGYETIEPADRISIFTSDTKTHLYDLIYASKNKRGKDFWQKVARKALEGSQKTLF